MKKWLLHFTGVTALVLLPAISFAMPLLPGSSSGGIFTATDGFRSASAAFEKSGNELSITLTNTSTYRATIPRHILTAIFFDVEGDFGFQAESAMLGSGSTVVNFIPTGDFQDSTNNNAGGVGGEWAYRSDIAPSENSPGNAQYGISSTGVDIFGPQNRFSLESNLWGPECPDGLQYGIVDAGYVPGDGNPKVATTPLIQNSVVFTLVSSDPDAFADFSIDDISNVSFLYGTSLDETPPVPEPATILLLGSAAMIFGFDKKRKRNKI